MGNEETMRGVGTVKPPQQGNEHEIIGLEKTPVRVVSPEYS